MKYVKGFVTGLSLLLVHCAASADFKVSKEFSVESDGKLTLETRLGSIEVSTHSKKTIEVDVDVEGLDEDEFKVTFEHSGKNLEVVGEKSGSDWGWGGKKRVRFSLVVPKNYHVDVNTQGGSIHIEELKGSVQAETSGGSLKFEDIVGNINGHTSGGSISVSTINGDVKISTSGGSLRLADIDGTLYGRTSGGSISLENISGDTDIATSGGSIKIKGAGGAVQAKTSGGSVNVTMTKQPKKDSDISTSGGSITVNLAEGIAVDLYARGHKVVSDFPVNGEKKAKYKLRGPINGGGPELEVQTSSGSVYINKI